MTRVEKDFVDDVISDFVNRLARNRDQVNENREKFEKSRAGHAYTLGMFFRTVLEMESEDGLGRGTFEELRIQVFNLKDILADGYGLDHRDSKLVSRAMFLPLSIFLARHSGMNAIVQKVANDIRKEHPNFLNFAYSSESVSEAFILGLLDFNENLVDQD